MTFLPAPDQDVEILIGRKPRGRAGGRISVVAAQLRRQDRPRLCFRTLFSQADDD